MIFKRNLVHRAAEAAMRFVTKCMPYTFCLSLAMFAVGVFVHQMYDRTDILLTGLYAILAHLLPLCIAALYIDGVDLDFKKRAGNALVEKLNGLGDALLAHRKAFVRQAQNKGVVVVPPPGWSFQSVFEGDDPYVKIFRGDTHVVSFLLTKRKANARQVGMLMNDQIKGIVVDPDLLHQLTEILPAALAAAKPVKTQPGGESAGHTVPNLTAAGPLAPQLAPVWALLDAVTPTAPASAQAVLRSFHATCFRLQTVAESLPANAPALAVFQDSVLPRVAQLLTEAKPFLRLASTDGDMPAPLLASLESWATYSAQAVDALRRDRLNAVVAGADVRLKAAVAVDPVGVAPVAVPA